MTMMMNQFLGCSVHTRSYTFPSSLTLPVTERLFFLDRTLPRIGELIDFNHLILLGSVSHCCAYNLKA